MESKLCPMFHIEIKKFPKVPKNACMFIKLSAEIILAIERERITHFANAAQIVKIILTIHFLKHKHDTRR